MEILLNLAEPADMTLTYRPVAPQHRADVADYFRLMALA